jgi:hypothetical protein
MIIERLGSGFGIFALLCASIACLCTPPMVGAAPPRGDQHAHACCATLPASPEHDRDSEKNCPHCHQASLTIDSSTRFDARPIDSFIFLPVLLDSQPMAVVAERVHPRVQSTLFLPSTSLLEAHCALLL